MEQRHGCPHMTRRDPVLVDDFARPNPSHKALRNDLPLLLNRPAPPPLASGNHLDPLSRGSHMTTLMTAPYRTVALDRRMLAVHAKPSAHRPRSRQGVLSTPLTVLVPLVGFAEDLSCGLCVLCRTARNGRDLQCRGLLISQQFEETMLCPLRSSTPTPSVLRRPRRCCLRRPAAP